MAATTGGHAWPLPEQSTNPPDVVAWLSQGLNAADADLTEEVAAVNARIQYGPVANVPASLPDGTLWLGY
jgi:hypothetical protein